MLTDPQGKTVLKETGKMADLPGRNFSIQKPQLWWTHDHGKPSLYASVFQMKDNSGTVLSEVTQKVGFRRVRLVMHEGAWNKPDTFPKGRSNPPITVELNGRRIFAKGSNWVNPEIFPGILTRERYNGLLNLALKSNFNMFRVWGGGIVNKESFYELCDEKGILVWTEFPLACNNYEGTPHYLAVLKQESEAIIRKVRSHASHALWCGGNELFNSWSGMTDQSLALRLLNSQCYLFDPLTPFIPTSPVMGMSHGNYIFRYQDNGREVFQQMPRSVATAYTEFGMPGAASVELLKKIIPEKELFPPQRGTSWESHHAFGAWVGDTWLMKELLASYFGEALTLEELVAQSQWLQTEGYKCIFEEGRRQKPICSMTLNWCYNEPWITAANNSLISYPDIPKPAFYGVADACRPFLASARIPKFSWRGGEMFSCDIFILNDLYENIPSGVVTVKLKAAGQEVKLLSWEFKAPGENRNLQGPTVRGILPFWNTDRMELVLEVEGKPEYSSRYLLQYKQGFKPRSRTGTPRMNE
jgi:beta-mannosidase